MTLSMEVTQRKEKTTVVSWLYSVLFALNISVGGEIYIHNGVDRFCNNISFLGKEIALAFIVTIATYIFIEKILLKVVSVNSKSRQDREATLGKKWLYVIWACVFFGWLPAFFAYYPGILSYDSNIQTQMVMGMAEFTRFHPPIHTFIWKICIFIGGKTGVPALSIYGLFQMALLSLTMAYLLFVIFREKPGKIFIILSTVFIAFNPVMAVMSLAMTKDVPFAMALIGLALCLLKMVKNPDAFFGNLRDCVVLILLSVLSGLLRNNMVYALVFSFIFMVVVIREHRKELICISLISIYALTVITGPLYSALEIGPGNSREALSVPVQQIARTVINHEDEISEQDEAVIRRFLPYDYLARIYNPRLSDPVKDEFKTDYFDHNKDEFFDLWGRLFQKYPLEYINAFADLNIPSWYILASPVDPYSKRDYIETYIYEMDYYPVERESKAPGLLNYYESFASYDVFSNMSAAVALPFSIASPVWVLLTCILLLVRRGRARYVTCVVPFFFLWLTYMAGPVSNFRYIFPIYACYPLFFYLALVESRLEAI